MMNAALRRLAAEWNLESPHNRRLAVAFGYGCVARVQHLFELDRARALFGELAQAAQRELPAEALADAAHEAAALARSHPGSTSIDGSGHSAVTATHALARALGGHAVDAAEYAAYALVYSYGRYAVADPESFAVEFAWQVEWLRRLLREAQPAVQ
jgi:hypothetical protein